MEVVGGRGAARRRRGRMRRARPWPTGVGALLAVVGVVASMFGATTVTAAGAPELPDPAPAAVADAPARTVVPRAPEDRRVTPQPVAWLIGDSQTDTDGSWVVRGLQAQGYDVRVSAASGTGYVSAGGGRSGHPGIRDSLAQGVYVAPGGVDLIVVQAGGNDQLAPLDEVRAAAEASFDALRRLCPDARMLVVGPLVQGPDLASERVAISVLLEEVADARGYAFVDATSWVPKYDLRPQLVDDRHFSPEGHARLTAIFARELTSAGMSTSPRHPEAR